MIGMMLLSPIMNYYDFLHDRTGVRLFLFSCKLDFQAKSLNAGLAFFGMGLSGQPITLFQDEKPVLQVIVPVEAQRLRRDIACIPDKLFSICGIL
jgi:hypothetical protein